MNGSSQAIALSAAYAGDMQHAAEAGQLPRAAYYHCSTKIMKTLIATLLLIAGTSAPLLAAPTQGHSEKSLAKHPDPAAPGLPPSGRPDAS